MLINDNTSSCNFVLDDNVILFMRASGTYLLSYKNKLIASSLITLYSL